MSKKMQKWMIIVLVAVICGGLLWYFLPDLDGYPDVRNYGIVPEEFRWMVEEDFLNDVSPHGETLVRVEDTDTGRRITKYDLYGKELSTFEYAFESVDPEPSSLTSGVSILLLDDGGYLVCVDDQNVVGRENSGNDLTLIKYDPSGAVQWEYALSGESRYGMFITCTELPDGYYLWLRESWITDEYLVLALNLDGTLKFEQVFSLSGKLPIGADASLPTLMEIEYHDGTLTMYADVGPAGDLFVTLDMELDVLSAVDAKDPLTAIGTVDGEPVRYGLDYYLDEDGNEVLEYAGEGILEDYPYGVAEMVVDYGDFYLVLSWKDTGINYFYTGPGIIGGRPMRTQSVYAAYDKDGTLLWIGTVDSTRNS